MTTPTPPLITTPDPLALYGTPTDVDPFDAAGAAAAAQAASLQKNADLSDLASATTARTNLGLGSSATQTAAVINVKDYGARGDGITDDSAAIQAALNAVPALQANDWLASGWQIVFPAGTYAIGSTVTFPMNNSRVRLVGVGKGATVLMRTANVIMLDVSGIPDSSANQIMNISFSDLTLTSSTRGLGTWTQPLMRCYYAQFIHFDRVNFYRAGGSAIAGLRMYDCEFHNCRWDYCGSSGYAAAHFMCSEQGATAGNFGYSTDSCNNLYFLNCTWEQNPGTDLYLDGRQSDGTLNASRRINMCRMVGCKMENQIATERSDDPRCKLQNTAHLDIMGLVVSANGTVSGNPTDWLVCDTNYNLYATHVTLVGTEVATASAMRTGLSLVGTNTNTRFGLVCGSVQSIQKPTVALVEFNGTNTCKIDNAYYDSNPRAAAIYSGTPTVWVGDDNPASPPLFGTRLGFQATRQLTANTAFMTRFVPTKPMKVTAIKFVVSTAAGGNDNVDVGILDSSGNRLGSSGATASKLNATGIQSVTLSAPVQLNPGQVYYLTIGGDAAGASTQATIIGIGSTSGNTNASQVGGTNPPDVEWTSKATSIPIPSSITSPNAGISSSVAGWAVTA